LDNNNYQQKQDIFSFQIQHDLKNFLLLCAGVEGPCLHRPENWLMRQLTDEPKPEYKVGFIREKAKATARALQQSPEAGGSLLR
jgi:hypothetical protein